jgi:hypothetical protein
MANTVDNALPSKAQRLQQLITENLGSFAIRVCGKCAALQALQTKVEDLQRDNERLTSNAQAAKQSRLTQPTPGDVFETDVLVKRVLEFVGPNEYLFAASVSRKCRQVQIVISYKRAEGSSSKKAKLRTSFTAALASPARLQWAFSTGLKQKDKYYKPLQLVQVAMEVSSDAASVLSLLNVQSLKKVDQQAGAELCEAAAENGDLELLKWLHAHDCAWDAETCNWAAFNGLLDILMWVREQGCPWDEAACSWAAEGGHLHILQWAHKNGCPWNELTCLKAAWKGHLHILQWARERGCPWDEHTCRCAARNGHLHILQWARANGCSWNLGIVLRFAASIGNITALEWLQQNSEREWTAAVLTSMLDIAGVYTRMAAAKWLIKKGAEWPSSFAGIDLDFGYECFKGCWTPRAVQWALARGSTWREWKCEQLAPELYTRTDFKDIAVHLFAWAHKNGCPCTCNGGSGSSGSNETN